MKYLVILFILMLYGCEDKDKPEINCDERPSLGTYEPCPMENG